MWAQDSFNLKNNKAVSYQDIPQIFVLSYVYELPVGPNKKFLDKKGVVGKIVGGWQVSGVQRYQSGSPISFTCGFPVTAFPTGPANICADRVPGQSWLAGSAGSFNPGNAVLALKSGGSLACNGIGSAPTNLPAGIQPYFNCAGFADTNSATNVAARGYAFGNIPRTVGNIRSAHYYNEDFSVIKNTYITENQFIQFRADFLNAFNRHTFAVPDTNYSDSTFGIPGRGDQAWLSTHQKRCSSRCGTSSEVGWAARKLSEPVQPLTRRSLRSIPLLPSPRGRGIFLMGFGSLEFIAGYKIEKVNSL